LSGCKILDFEKFLGKRSETMFIKKQKNGINLQSDTEHLDDAYNISILSKLQIVFFHPVNHITLLTHITSF